MINVAVLGITGSIGQTALKAINASNQVKLCGATYHIRKPENLSCPLLKLDSNYEELKDFLNKIRPDVVLNAISSSEGLKASLWVIDCNITLALANKESVVMGGSFFTSYAKEKGVKVIPVDSEHSAIDELIKVHGINNIDKIIITASGGPFRTSSLEELYDITPREAIKHPTWNMGQKISIDSATLANKGLEVIEAHYLFGFDTDNIEVVIHPQSIVHSMVRTTSGQVYAQMSPPDMTFPIMRALLDRNFTTNVGSPLDFTNLCLTFEKADLNKYGFIADAYECIKYEGAYPIVFNTVNEIAVSAFIKGKIKFPDIYKTVHNALSQNWNKPNSLEDVFELQEEINRKVIL